MLRAETISYSKIKAVNQGVILTLLSMLLDFVTASLTVSHKSVHIFRKHLKIDVSIVSFLTMYQLMASEKKSSSTYILGGALVLAILRQLHIGNQIAVFLLNSSSSKCSQHW